MNDKYDVKAVNHLTPEQMRKVLLHVAREDHDLFNELMLIASYVRGRAS